MAEDRDDNRIESIRSALVAADLDAVVCALPMNVLLLSGYWPVVGGALAVAARDGRIVVVAPEDERELVEEGWADRIITYRPTSLDALPGLEEVLRKPLASLADGLKLGAGRIARESGPTVEQASYASTVSLVALVPSLIERHFPAARLENGDALLSTLRMVKTPREVDRIRSACRIAERAFRAGAERLRPGLLETEAATGFRGPLSTLGTGFEGVGRADGFAWCMTGPNAAKAKAAYARSRAKPLARDELTLVHCNSHADGYWTDITRTFSLSEPDSRRRSLYEAVFAARDAAFAALRPGARASDIDRAAREVFRERGFDGHFDHSAGHGVGFAAIDPNAFPRIHPASRDVLKPGMVFNVEPALYFDRDCGIRHCDVVAVNDAGFELLTPFQATVEELILR